MTLAVAVLPGDGIGPEVTAEAVRVLEAAAPDLEATEAPIGLGAFEAHGAPLPPDTLGLVERTGLALMGAVTTPVDVAGYRSPVLGLRRGLDLYANVRPCAAFPHPSSRAGVDLVVVRENTEGLYAGRERTEAGGDLAVTERVITRAASARIVRYACELARAQGRRRVTVVHKANVLRATCGLFRRVALEVAAGYPDLDVDERLVDACAMDLLRRPEAFGVIVTTNLFGDILSDEASMLTGGLGLACSGNVGERAAVFEPVHGSAPDIAGQGRANPLAAILSAALLLEHAGRADAAGRVRQAVARALEAGETTADLGGGRDTRAAAEAVLKRI